MQNKLLNTSCMFALLIGCALVATPRDAANAAETTPAPAAQAAAPGTLETITVTAEYRSKNLQDTPIAITAFSGQNLEVRGITSVTGLGAFVPNTIINPLGAGWGSTYAAFIRGVGLGDNILSFEPGVPIYVDDVYNGRPQGSIFDLLDLERVEVLRGPQGTLFGKNAMGGAIRLISRKPQGDGSGSIEGTYGSFQRINVRGAYDMSIIPDTMFARVSFSSKHADGYFDILNYECVNGPGSLHPLDPTPPIDLGTNVGSTTNNGCVVDTLGDEGVDSARAAVRWLGGEAVEFNLIADFTRQRQKGPADKYTIINDTGLNALWNDLVAEPTFGIRYNDAFITPSPYTNYNTYTDPLTGRITTPNINNLDHWGVSGTLDWELSETLHLKSISAYRQWWNEFGRDSDGSPLPVDDTFDDSRHRQFTQEVRLTGETMWADWTLGGFYYQANDSNQGFNFLYPLVIQNQDSVDTQSTKDWAGFLHVVFHVTDKFDVTGGVRYTDTQKNAIIARTTVDGIPNVPPTPIGVSANEWSPLFELDYKVTPDLMVYALYSTGFKGGGFSPRASHPLQVTSFDVETLTNYETGFKSEWFEHRLRLNADVFYMNYEDQQNYKNDEAPPGNPWFHAINAGQSRNWGVEAELQAEPIDGLQFEGSLGYLNYKLEDDGGSHLCKEFSDGDPCYPTRAPEWNWAFGAQYTANLGTGGTLTPRVDVTYQSKVWFATFNDIEGPPGVFSPPPKPAGDEGSQGAYTLVNARVTWEAPDDQWEVALFSNNLTDEVYFYGKLSLVALLSREQGNVAPGRTWGITVKRTF